MSHKSGIHKHNRKAVGVLGSFEKEVGTTVDKFPQRLRELREKQHKKRQTVSELCGLPSGAVRRYERGEALPRADSLAALAEYFGVTTDYLLGLTDDREGTK